MNAIIQTGGKQYTVKVGDVVRVERIELPEGSVVKFAPLATYNAGETVLSPKAEVSAKILAEKKDKKVVVYKYKAKKNERRKKGHRQIFTEIEITAIG